MMGHFAARAGITAALFRAAAAWIGHFRGGLAMAAIGGCAAFGTVSGSSLATAAMMGQVALPELRRYKYAGGFATGTLAAGGTLGILIPPSIVLIIFAIIVRGEHRLPVSGRLPARRAGDVRIHDRDCGRVQARPGDGARWAARHDGRALAGVASGLGGGRHFCRSDGRDLSGDIHADGSRRHRRGCDVSRRGDLRRNAPERLPRTLSPRPRLRPP